MKLILGISLLGILGVSCSRGFERDYKVVDASHQEIPEWTEELHEWLDDEIDSDELKKNRFYVYHSEPKTSRDISCKIAKAESAASVASEISTFIKENFATATNGDPTKSDQKLSEYVQNDLFKEVKATVTGIQEYRKYWEKRRFMKDEGAAKNWDGFVCSVLVKVPKSQLKKAFARTEEMLKKQSSNSAKDQVSKIMEKAAEEYTK